MSRRSSGKSLLAMLNTMLKKILVALIAVCGASSWADVPFRSMYAMVVDDDTGEVLLEKNAEAVVPIASLTKLMTAMVILDARQNPNTLLRIEKADVNSMGYRGFGVPVGAYVTRNALLELALMSSDNHAAMALARAYPGGFDAFRMAMDQKIRDLGLISTSLEEPTGLSPNNRSSAVDVVKLVRAASAYPEIAAFTTQSDNLVEVRGRKHQYRNTNHLVGAPGWNILVSKTGFTNPAGRCVAMRMMTAGKTVTVVLLGAWDKMQRTRDAFNVREWLSQARNSVAKAEANVRQPQVVKAVYKAGSAASISYPEEERAEIADMKEGFWSLKMDVSMPGVAQ